MENLHVGTGASRVNFGKKRKKKAKYDLGSDTSSVWNFCTCCPDVISRGNQGRRRKMLAVFFRLDSLELDLTLKNLFIIFR